MATIEATYLKELQADPGQSVKVIITTEADPKAYVAKMEALGLKVTRTFWLTSTAAATGPAGAVVTLASETWVSKIERILDESRQGRE